MRTPALAPNPFRGLSRHPASRRDPTTVLDTGCPGSDPETLERLPFGEAADRTALAARPAPLPIPPLDGTRYLPSGLSPHASRRGGPLIGVTWACMDSDLLAQAGEQVRLLSL